MISIINQKFEPNIANNIIKYLQHPAATMIRDHFEESDDDEWKTLYGFAEPGRYYITYGGGPSGGIVRFRNHGWYEWHQQWLGHKVLTRIPDGKVIVWRPETDEYSEAVKIVDGPYDLKEDESFLDDLEDTAYDYRPEAELIHPDDMEEDEEDGDDEQCDCCGEYWDHCQCICSNCSNDYRICRANCYDESDDEVRANFQSMAMNF